MVIRQSHPDMALTAIEMAHLLAPAYYHDREWLVLVCPNRCGQWSRLPREDEAKPARIRRMIEPMLAPSVDEVLALDRHAITAAIGIRLLDIEEFEITCCTCECSGWRPRWQQRLVLPTLYGPQLSHEMMVERMSRRACGD